MENPQEQNNDDLEEGEIESNDEVITALSVNQVIDESINNRQPPESQTSPKSGVLIRATTKKSSPIPTNPPPIGLTSREHAAGIQASPSLGDDWMESVETSIAMALKNKGIDPPPMPTFLQKEPASGKKRNKKQRRNKKNKSAKSIADGQQNPGQVRYNLDADDVDEYEMLCIRGGSPPTLNNNTMQSSIGSGTAQQLQHDEQYFSNDSYSSYEERRCRQNKKSGGTSTGSQRKGDEKRRRLNKDVSEDDHQPRQIGPKKLELCKFYLMECCAKRANCLYMHSDFPCKYYYLGMKNHDQDNCKFSHGKPLTEQLRKVLLKHLETAPKEILGDFPRLHREIAVQMLNKQHEILLCEHWIEPTASNTSTLKVRTIQNINQTHKKQQQSDYSESVGSAVKVSSDKQRSRRTRWCNMATATQPAALTGKSKASKLSSTSVQIFNDVLSNEQIENLAAIGIKTLDQINQLTIAQLNQFGLSIAQIHGIQLKSMNIQTDESAAVEMIAPTTGDTLKLPFYGDFGIGGTDFDMRQQLTEAYSGNQDIDMRISPDHQFVQPRQHINNFLEYLKESNLELPTVCATTNAKEEVSSSTFQRALSVICGNRDSDDNDDDDVEDEPTLEIDESWYSDDEDDDNPNPIEQPEPLNPLAMAPIPAQYDPSALYPTTIINKTDLSSSVTQFKVKSSRRSDESNPTTIDDSSKPITEHVQPNTMPSTSAVELSLDFMASKDNALCMPPRDPRKLTIDPKPETKKQPFELFTCHIPETIAPTQIALDKNIRTPIATSATSETKSDEYSTLMPTVSLERSLKTFTAHPRTSIYEDDSFDSETEATGPNTKDKDMRLSSFVDKANSKGDIDFRLPFKPVKPDSEIQASIHIHDPIRYVVSKVDVAKPDYSDVRRNISTTEEICDPRLRRMLRLSNASSETEHPEDKTPYTLPQLVNAPITPKDDDQSVPND